jgi:hypothetical protein
MKSPEIKTVVKTDVLTITELVPVTRTVEVARPHNCLPVPEPDRGKLQTADGAIGYLITVQRQYQNCLNSLE